MGFRNVKEVVDAYGLNPQSALPRNQLFWSQDLTKSSNGFGERGWANINTATRPNATTINLPANGDYVFQSVFKNISIGTKVTISVTLSGSGTLAIHANRANTQTGIGYGANGAGEGSPYVITLTGTPTRYSSTWTYANNQIGAGFRIGRLSGETATTVTATDFQLEFSDSATTYQYTGASLAYDDPIEAGRHHYQLVFRNTNLFAVVGLWVDSSMSGGSPKYNAYVGGQLESTPLVGNGNNGIYAGPTPPAGMTKHIAKISVGTMSTTAPIQRAMLMDYLMFYPLIDGDSTDLQEMINTEVLPRYSDGDGVQMALVQTGGASYNNSFVTIKYTNSDGVADRIANSSYAIYGSNGNIGCTNYTGANSGAGHRFVLQGADKGVRSVQSIQFSQGTGIFFALVLFKPICDIQMLESTTQSEIDYVNQRLSLPVVKDGAYLNFICHYGATASSTLPLHAGIDFIWS